MQTVLIAFAFAALVWWASTGLILRAIALPRQAHSRLAVMASLVLAAASIGVVMIGADATIRGAYAGFALGVLSWGWHEVMFLLGLVTGPNKAPCPANASMGERFAKSFNALAYHEAAIAVHAIALMALSWGASNKTALWTFLLLWAMRLSAKLVIFFGAPNTPDAFLPERLSYMKTYFHKRAGSAASMIAGLFTLGVFLSLCAATAAAPDAFSSTVLALLASLAGLAVFEHLVLLLSIPDAALWSWAVPANDEHPLKKEASSEWRQ